MIEVKGLDHVVLRTNKIKDMLHFYQDIFHCPIERELPELGLTQLRAGDALIDLVRVNSELGKLGGKAPSQNGRNVDHFCLQIAPFEEDELLSYLDQCGLNYEPFAERYGAQGFSRSIYVYDPEGNVVELKAKLTP
ncbi:VOC family protein [Vibrio sp. Isolate25]|uniref:VOC family protein n=1 Tax=unclassified Vibrio TaxID=2614977 RepID=UPI001EFCB99B|nr:MULTISPECIES: VOC family protein [unclassified Vibrio]MCG9595468.1 VOC family protein [Vibrio sp. Isolate25]MCG9676960.1 VOC family protein [Vibrio sp. Isolate24]